MTEKLVSILIFSPAKNRNVPLFSLPFENTKPLFLAHFECFGLSGMKLDDIGQPEIFILAATVAKGYPAVCGRGPAFAGGANQKEGEKT